VKKHELVIKMKHRVIHIFIWLVFTVLISCSSTASNNPGEQPKAKQKKLDNSSFSSFFTGLGGKGMSLGILVPESKGLNANQEYLPSMVQGCLVSNISKYSAITVMDRVSLDRVIAETLDPTYKDNLDIVRLGHVAQVGYMMTGNIMRTSTGYTLQLNVTETTPNAPTIASYSGTCNVAQFDDFSAINQASKELLKQMGVQLTNAAVNELDKPSSSQAISAQANLARGITAQQRGTTVEAMAYYYNAVSFEPKLTEANGRLSILSSNISSGNIGENVRNDIQRRKAWLDILKECEDYFTKHPPYEIVYHTNLVQGNIDYQRETVNLSFILEVNPTDAFQIVNDILKGLETTGKKREWDIEYWPLSSNVFASNTDRYLNLRLNDAVLRKHNSIIFNLSNSNGKIIAKTVANTANRIKFENYHANWKTYKFEWDERIITDKVTKEIVFERINANDITDNLTIKIVSVNGVDIAKNPDYIRITAK
jgi:hypothetical protein